MFDYCEIEKKKCAFCAAREDDIYCGVASGTNKIAFMKNCPLPDIKKRSKLSSKKMGL